MDKPPPPPQPPQPPPSNPPSQTPNPPRPLHQRPQPQLFGRQQHAAMARFPSNIDAHLRPLGSLRPFFNPVPVPVPVPNLNANPNPNPIPAAAIHTPPPTNPNNLGSLLPHIPPSKPIRTPLPPPSDLPRHRPDPFPIPIPIPPPHPPPRDKAKDDAFFTVSDRKVRISERNDLYALCRSWLRNGYREESQPQYGDSLKSLPKPLHLPEPSSPVKKEMDDETDGEDENAIWTLSAEELLQRHVKRAKRVRERLREERLRRIKRYKSRLKLLLPSPLEQCRGDTAPS